MGEKRKSGFRYKKRCVAVMVCMMAAMLCGCGGKYPELSDDQEQAILRYAATLLYDNDQNRESRLMSEDEMILAMQRRAAHNYMPPTPVPGQKDDAALEQTGGEGGSDSGSAPVVETRTLAEFFGFSGIDISYQGYLLTKSYPEEDPEEFYFAMDALAGNELLLLQYTITNQNAEAARVDILSLKPRFRLFINDGAQINAMSTLLLDDMRTTDCTLQPGESCHVVVVFEVTEEEAASIQKLRLTVKAEDDSWTVELLGSGELSSYNDDGGNSQASEPVEEGAPILSYNLPEEFVEAADGVYFAPDYPNDTANIMIVSSDYDAETFRYTQDAYCRTVEEMYKQLYGDEVTVNCTEFTESELNGCRTLLIRVSCSMQDVEMEQVQFAVETGENKTTVITYTQAAGGPWMDAFNESVGSVRIENAG